MTVGDLVECSSCLNYKTGPQVDTLPSYVIDANIKLALGFIIPTGILKTVPDSIIKLVRDNSQDLVHKFYPEILTLELFDPKTENSFRIKLSKAIHRRVLRLGSINVDTCLFSERSYIQNHEIEGIVK
jgi:hypothetical protein